MLSRHSDPNAYAPWQEAKEDRAKYVFNCAQRAHANFLEHQPQFLIPLLISGLRYPVASAVLGLAWCVARVMYAVGYVTGKAEGGKGRCQYSRSSLCLFCIMQCALRRVQGALTLKTFLAYPFSVLKEQG